MSRRLRKLDVPTEVFVHYRGENTKVSEPGETKADQKFSIGLGELKESVRFRVRGDDYWTRPMKITLVPPPSVTSIVVDKEEPAYLYWRLQGSQTLLGLWIALTLGLVIYAMVDASRPKPPAPFVDDSGDVK